MIKKLPEKNRHCWINQFKRKTIKSFINKVSLNVITKATVSRYLEMTIKPCLFMLFTPQTFLIVILVFISTVSKLVFSLIVILHTIYIVRQEVDQAFIVTYKFFTYFANLLTNKQLKYFTFYNVFEDLAAISHFSSLSLKRL